MESAIDIINTEPKNEFNINNFTELRNIEQYFFSDNVLKLLVDIFNYENNIVCLCTPAVAEAFYRLNSKIVKCLDIDSRFDYLPGYLYYDVLKPTKIDFDINILIVDPPFFMINLIDLHKCIDLITNNNKRTKIIFAYVMREERSLLNVFKDYKLRRTKFKLEYKYVDPTKWSNYCLYSNFEIGKIKFCEALQSKKKDNKK